MCGGKQTQTNTRLWYYLYVLFSITFTSDTITSKLCKFSVFHSKNKVNDWRLTRSKEFPFVNDYYNIEKILHRISTNQNNFFFLICKQIRRKHLFVSIFRHLLGKIAPSRSFWMLCDVYALLTASCLRTEYCCAVQCTFKGWDDVVYELSSARMTCYCCYPCCCCCCCSCMWAGVHLCWCQLASAHKWLPNLLMHCSQPSSNWPRGAKEARWTSIFMGNAVEIQRLQFQILSWSSVFFFLSSKFFPNRFFFSTYLFFLSFVFFLAFV